MIQTSNLSHERFLAMIEEMCLLDDFYFNVFVHDRHDIIEFMLKIILDKNLKVISMQTQKEIKSITGRSVVLDVLAKDENNKLYNIEIQNDNAGAIPERARYHASMCDSSSLQKGANFNELPETYIIFITRNDTLKGNLPIYHIDRYIKELNYQLFDDKLHIIYVNCSFDSNDALGKLIADFKCKDPSKMNYQMLAQRADYYKHKEEGKMEMNGVMQKFIDEIKEEYINEGMLEGIKRERAVAKSEKRDIIANLLNSTNLTKSEIAANFRIPLSEVEAIANQNNSAKPTL